MELLHLFGTPEQKSRWLEPLLEGTIRSGFAMTEPGWPPPTPATSAPRSGATATSTSSTGTSGGPTGAADPRCELLVRDGQDRSDRGRPTANTQWSSSRGDTPGVEIIRSLPILGYHDQHGHCEIRFTDVRVPVSNLLGGEGEGFAMAQARLGPGRVHHAMRTIGMAERGLELMVRRAMSREAFGGPLVRPGRDPTWIAESRMAMSRRGSWCSRPPG